MFRVCSPQVNYCYCCSQGQRKQKERLEVNRLRSTNQRGEKTRWTRANRGGGSMLLASPQHLSSIQSTHAEGKQSGNPHMLVSKREGGGGRATGAHRWTPGNCSTHGGCKAHITRPTTIRKTASRTACSRRARGRTTQKSGFRPQTLERPCRLVRWRDQASRASMAYGLGLTTIGLGHWPKWAEFLIAVGPCVARDAPCSGRLPTTLPRV